MLNKRINFSYCHDPDVSQGRCSVCLMGSVSENFSSAQCLISLGLPAALMEQCWWNGKWKGVFTAVIQGKTSSEELHCSDWNNALFRKIQHRISEMHLECCGFFLITRFAKNFNDVVSSRNADTNGTFFKLKRHDSSEQV